MPMGPFPPIVRFLTIDTTENTEHSEKARDGSTVALEPNEQYVLSIANPAGLVSGTNEHIDEWWPQNIPISAIVAGAGQVRARGRLALFAKSTRHLRSDPPGNRRRDWRSRPRKRMYDASASMFQTAAASRSTSSAASQAATGSGIFLDVAFISRSFIDSESNITGVMVLPRIFQGPPGVQLVKPNAYAALKELERFTKMEPRDQFSIDYGTHHVEVSATSVRPALSDRRRERVRQGGGGDERSARTGLARHLPPDRFSNWHR